MEVAYGGLFLALLFAQLGLQVRAPACNRLLIHPVFFEADARGFGWVLSPAVGRLGYRLSVDLPAAVGSSG